MKLEDMIKKICHLTMASGKWANCNGIDCMACRNMDAHTNKNHPDKWYCGAVYV